MNKSVLTEIDAIAATGKAVIADGGDGVVEVVKAAILADVSASFYLTKEQARAVKDWFWTPERIRRTGLREISDEENERIKSELGLKLTGFRFTPVTCECGHVYGAFDFLQQGIKLHGLDAVRSVFALKNATLFQVNPTFKAVCPVDNRPINKQPGKNRIKLDVWGIEYDCDQYGGCCCCA
ncbi:hypothetical protein [Arthrobacter sp. NicSoilB8]|uniref:hypothetical protein n=1 Tax=Arthrobacter sp. NicSoilB8 TaxID=2830998 RepID=UPI001CC8045F|nr:hypothetical protein [Arthrobacter sp. NicSoilB8]BCW70853.1 hypothetical protein NicSoilB8_18970 [Arthrobacter sp. NicSoilB8]